MLNSQLSKVPNKSSVLSTIKPIIFISQLTAFAIFTINPSTWRADIKKFNIFIGICAVALNLCLQYVFFLSLYDVGPQGTQMARTAFPKLVYMCIFAFSLAKAWSFLNRQKIVNFLRNFQEIDEKFGEINIHFDYDGDCKKIFKIMIGVIAFDLIVSLLSFCVQLSLAANLDWTLSIFTFFGNTSQFVIVFQVITALIGIRHRFEAINNYLIKKRSLNVFQLKVLSEIHLMTTDGIDSFNHFYGPIAMISMGLVFAWHCMFTFMTLMMTVEMWKEHPFVALFHIFMHTILLIIVYSVIYYAERAKKESRKAIKILYRKMSKSQDESEKGLIESLIYQVCDTRIEFSCGLIDFNWKFLFKFLTAAAMYFVILVQFESSFSEKSETAPNFQNNSIFNFTNDQ